MNKIKLFFLALKEAYLNITKEQREAKETIAITEATVIEYQQYLECIKNVYKNLSDVYNQFPKSQRRLYIQQTLDFIAYGFYYNQFKNDKDENVVQRINTDWSCGYANIYESFVMHDLKYIYDCMCKLYKEHKYKEVMEEYNTFKMTIDNFNEKYINDIKFK